MDVGFRIPIVSGIPDTLSGIPDFPNKNFIDSGFSYMGRVSFAGIFYFISSVDESKFCFFTPPANNNFF